jgi:DNA-directed RNA polymerase specialized sigma24 family protein
MKAMRRTREPTEAAERLGPVDVVRAPLITAEPIVEPDEPAIAHPHADVDIVPAAVDLSSASFTDFYRLHRDPVVRALALTLDDRDLATEAVDEAMARAYQRWSQVAGLDNAPGWVYRVGFNWATSVLRRRRRARDHVYERDHTGLGAINEPDVMRALAELDVRQRAVVVCR